jgi:hypothetical protein
LCTLLHIVGECARFLGEVQLPGEAAAAAEGAQQLQQQAEDLHSKLQQQLQVLEQAGDGKHFRATAEAQGRVLQEPTALAAGAVDDSHRLPQQATDAAAAAAAAESEAAQAAAAMAVEAPAAQAAAAVPDSSHTTEVNLQQELQRAFPGDLLQQLQQFGEAVCHQLPVSLWCCNPRCSNLQKQSEQELVGGKGCVCSACHTARFCSKECLQACWKKQQHRGVCKRLAAASSSISNYAAPRSWHRFAGSVGFESFRSSGFAGSLLLLLGQAPGANGPLAKAVIASAAQLGCSHARMQP